jgi:hypothetical protein
MTTFPRLVTSLTLWLCANSRELDGLGFSEKTDHGVRLLSITFQVNGGYVRREFGEHVEQNHQDYPEQWLTQFFDGMFDHCKTRPDGKARTL